jgi:hypothetical protein
MRKAFGPEHPTDQNNSCRSSRTWPASSASTKSRFSERREPFAPCVFEATVRTRGIDHPLTVHRRNNLSLTLLMLDRVDEARFLLAESWHASLPSYANLTSSIPYLALLADRLGGDPAADPTGYLKTLLCGPELPRAPDVAHPWDVAYLLDYLRPKLPHGATNSSRLSSPRSTIRPRRPRSTASPSGAIRPPCPATRHGRTAALLGYPTLPTESSVPPERPRLASPNVGIDA